MKRYYEYDNGYYCPECDGELDWIDFEEVLA